MSRQSSPAEDILGLIFTFILAAGLFAYRLYTLRAERQIGHDQEDQQ